MKKSKINIIRNIFEIGGVRFYEDSGARSLFMEAFGQTNNFKAHFIGQVVLNEWFDGFENFCPIQHDSLPAQWATIDALPKKGNLQYVIVHCTWTNAEYTLINNRGFELYEDTNGSPRIKPLGEHSAPFVAKVAQIQACKSLLYAVSGLDVLNLLD